MNFVPAPAKLNLALSVIGRRADGRHTLCSVVVHLDWHDLVGAEMVPDAAAGIELMVTGPRAAEAPAGDNLMARAARAILPNAARLGVRLSLDKRLPAAAGLGGGSADAAAVLRLLGPPGPEIPVWMVEIADQLGSDVPGCLAGGSLLVSGAGERLQRLRHPPLHLAVALAGRSGTAATFHALVAGEHRGPDRPERLARLLESGADLDAALCGSDLEAAACRAHPLLKPSLERLRAATPDALWHLTGSGGAAFALAGDAHAAAELVAAAAAIGLPARVCRTVDAVGAPRLR